MNKYDPISKAFPHMLHGGDYNPDQWKKYPEIIDEDMRLLKEANCNCVSIGIFSWATLEPEEGKYDFSFFDALIDKLHKNGIKVVLATPSGSKPMWMAKKYPEIRRTNHMLLKEPMGDRHNHCYTSPIYREKIRAINTRLAERYGNHPAVIAWHISNEYSGECHCPLCQEAFRAWLKNKYSNDLDKLNDAWWTGFWSHTFTEWDQLASPPVSGGGTIVCTYMTGMVDENDLCYLGGFPAEDLKDVFGIWAQEINTLFDSAKDTAVIDTDALSFKGSYKVNTYTEIIEPGTAEILGAYENNFYAGTPCLTRNKYGKGYAYYIAFRDDNSFTQSFYDDLIDKLSITRGLDVPLPDGMSVHTRYDEEYTYYFVQNFSESDYTVNLPHDNFEFVLTGQKAGSNLNCESLSVQILRAPNKKEE